MGEREKRGENQIQKNLGGSTGPAVQAVSRCLRRPERHAPPQRNVDLAQQKMAQTKTEICRIQNC